MNWTLKESGAGGGSGADRLHPAPSLGHANPCPATRSLPLRRRIRHQGLPNFTAVDTLNGPSSQSDPGNVALAIPHGVANGAPNGSGTGTCDGGGWQGTATWQQSVIHWTLVAASRTPQIKGNQCSSMTPSPRAFSARHHPVDKPESSCAPFRPTPPNTW